MKSFNFIAWVAIVVLVAFTIPQAKAEAEVKRVCHEVNANKYVRTLKYTKM